MILLLATLFMQCPNGEPSCPAARSRAAAPNSVAVLPFENRTRDSNDTFLADGITDELIIRLSRIARLEVRSRLESDAVGRQAGTAAAMGRRLNASFLVTGTLQQSGQNVRFNVSLVRAATGRQVWGDTYARTGTDLFAIQSDIVSEVATAIIGQLLPGERSAMAGHRPRAPAAYDRYVRGVGAINSLSETGIRAGLQLLDQAITLDSTFADAYSRRALAWVMMADGYVDGTTGYSRARADARQAIRYDPANAFAYGVLSQAALMLDFNPAAAIALADSGLRIDPASSYVLQTRAIALLGTNDYDGAERGLLSAFEIDSLSVPNIMILAYLTIRSGRYDRLAAMMPRLRPVMPQDIVSYADGGLALGAGNAAEAARRLDWKWYGGLASGEYARALVQLGRQAEVRAIIDSMRVMRGQGYFNAMPVAMAYASIGDNDSTIAWLERAIDEHTSWLIGLSLMESLRPLRSDPRFIAIVRRVSGR